MDEHELKQVSSIMDNAAKRFKGTVKSLEKAEVELKKTKILLKEKEGSCQPVTFYEKTPRPMLF